MGLCSGTLPFQEIKSPVCHIYHLEWGHLVSCSVGTLLFLKACMLHGTEPTELLYLFSLGRGECSFQGGVKGVCMSARKITKRTSALGEPTPAHL